ncbi:MAG: 2'-5' RNA ligase family protein [Ilumatobacteraceae bacterium]
MLFVRGAVADRIDEIRRRWDPLMARRIDAHLTLIHDVVGHDAAAGRVAGLAADTAPFEITLTATGCWGGTANYGVYFGVDDPTGGIARLHTDLADLEAPRWARVPFRPHVTLVHGRTVDPQLAEPAWAALCDLREEWAVELSAIDIIELDDATGWTSVQRCDLTGSVLRDRPL